MDSTAALRSAFRAQMEHLELVRRRLLVAVSGGPDSVALLDLLAGAAGDCARELVVGHVDHGIHPSSAAIARQVRELARSYRLSVLECRLALGGHASETAARAARYRALETMRRDAKADFIVTAHHADDQAETVLMRVARGSGPAGLAGMAPRSGRIARPLLPFRRDELARHVLQLGHSVWHDPANSDPRHLRSWIRSTLVPVLADRIPDVQGQLVTLAEQAAVNVAGWDRVLDLLPGLDYRTESDGGSASLKVLEVVDDNLLTCLLMAICRKSNFSVGRQRVGRVIELIRSGRSGAQVPLGSGWGAEVSFDRLRLVRPRAEPAKAALELVGSQGTVAWADWRFSWHLGSAPDRQERTATTAWFERGPLRVRACRTGEKLLPLGGCGRRLIVRCLQEARVPRSQRGDWPALEHEGAVVWVPGVCRSGLLMPPPGAKALCVNAERA